MSKTNSRAGSRFKQPPKGIRYFTVDPKVIIIDLKLLGVTNGNSSAVNTIDTPNVRDKDTRCIDNIIYLPRQPVERLRFPP